MKTPYTPGPWIVDGVDDTKKIWIGTKKDGLQVAGVKMPDQDTEDLTREEAQANINLITAAPDLLEALMTLKTANGGYNFEGWHPAFREGIEKANAAIAKAIGEEGVSND